MDSVSRGGRKVFLIDEIGKMELFSQSFIRSVRETLDNSPCTILGTIPVPKGKPLGLVEEVRSRTDVKVFTVSTNMNTLLVVVVGGGYLGQFTSHSSYRPVFAVYLLIFSGTVQAAH